MQDKELRKKLGENAAQTAIEKFGDKVVQDQLSLLARESFHLDSRVQ